MANSDKKEDQNFIKTLKRMLDTPSTPKEKDADRNQRLPVLNEDDEKN